MNEEIIIESKARQLNEKIINKFNSAVLHRNYYSNWRSAPASYYKIVELAECTAAFVSDGFMGKLLGLAADQQ